MLSVVKNLILKHRKMFFQLTKVLMDQGLSSLTTFLAGMLLARACSKDDFAVYVLAFSIILTVLGFQRALISMPYTVCRNDFDEGLQRRYRQAIFLFRRLLLAGVIILGLPWLAWAVLREAPGNWPLLILFLLTLSGYTYCAFMKDTLLAELRVGVNLGLGTAVNLSVLAGLLLLFFIDKLSVSYYFIVLTVCMLLLPKVFRIMVYAGRAGRLTRRQACFFFRVNWRQGKWLSASCIVYSIVSQFYPWLLVCLAGKEQVAILGVVTGISRIFTPATQGLSNYFTPKLSLSYPDREKRKRYFVLLICLSAVCGTMLLLIGGLWGGEIIKLIYSDKYSGLYGIAFLGFMDQALILFALPSEIMLNVMKRPDVLFKRYVLWLIIMVTLGVILCWKYTVAGILIAMIVQKAAGLGYCYWVVIRKSRV